MHAPPSQTRGPPTPWALGSCSCYSSGKQSSETIFLPYCGSSQQTVWLRRPPPCSPELQLGIQPTYPGTAAAPWSAWRHAGHTKPGLCTVHGQPLGCNQQDQARVQTLWRRSAVLQQPPGTPEVSVASGLAGRQRRKQCCYPLVFL